MDCIFCRIISGEIPSEKVYSDEYVLAFRDISPKAPQHIIVVPREHIESANNINESNSAAVAKIFEAIPKIAQSLNLTNYRVVSNIGEDAGQTVFHLHFHLLGGRKLTEEFA